MATDPIIPGAPRRRATPSPTFLHGGMAAHIQRSSVPVVPTPAT